MKAFLLCTSALERWLDEADIDLDLMYNSGICAAEGDSHDGGGNQ